jgi:hypothetical protein
LGTPHQGGSGVNLGKLMVNIASVFVAADDRLLKHLERDSEWLQQQLGQYGPISGDFVTKFAFEEYRTPTVLGHSIMVSGHSYLYLTVGNENRLYRERLPLFPERPMRSPSLYMRITSGWSGLTRSGMVAIEPCLDTCELWLEMHVTLSARAGTLKIGSTQVCSLDLSG